MSIAIPSTHKAVAFTGNTDKLTELADVPTANPPPAGKILIKVKASALNPCDWKSVCKGRANKGDTMGCDAAGEVVAVGAGVEGFSVGDHVAAMVHGSYAANPTGGAFQHYLALDPISAIKFTTPLVSSTLAGSRKVNSFEGAASVPLSLSTAGVALQHNLGLCQEKSMNQGSFILIWGGATEAGLMAIQAAKKIYGLTVITTASKTHHNWLKEIGADFTFDYHDVNVVGQIKEVVGDNLTYALDTVSRDKTYKAAYQCLSTSKPAFLDNLLFLGAEQLGSVRKNVTLSQTNVFKVLEDDDKHLIDDYLAFWQTATKAVNSGLIVHPPLVILPGGFHGIEHGLELLVDGDVSCEKLIIRVTDTAGRRMSNDHKPLV